MPQIDGVPERRKMVTVEEATEQVQLMARRMALLYHHIGQVLSEQLGGDRAAELLRESVWRYGTECGEAVRRQVGELGLPLTVENYGKVPDLPRFGWRSEPGETGPRVTYCPLAAVWLEKGSADLGRLYCYVDQAKYQAYNNVECVHLKNVLDGDEHCLFSIREGS